MLLNIEDGIKCVKFAREVIEFTIKKDNMEYINLNGIFNENLGVFVSIHTYPSYNLRGCIGIPKPIMSLKKSIAEASKSVIKDPRFPTLSSDELDRIIIEVTILTKPEKIEIDDPEEYFSKIKIGRDGLIIESGLNSGLLLPQVPVEYNWDVKDFLSNLCLKAYLPEDAWRNIKTNIFKFSGQIFTEIEPNGNIKEKKLDGLDN
jgi:uncharacterized protein (TIGR00296 family)